MQHARRAAANSPRPPAPSELESLALDVCAGVRVRRHAGTEVDEGITTGHEKSPLRIPVQRTKGHQRASVTVTCTVTKCTALALESDGGSPAGARATYETCACRMSGDIMTRMPLENCLPALWKHRPPALGMEDPCRGEGGPCTRFSAKA